ncbi:MAG: SpoIIE family protein phosphatase, partial [Leptospira sp.]|nr:SpoIIE family protein phosphatase [Leptospira sp.]
MTMNYYLFIPLTAFIINGFILTYVFAQKRNDSVTRSYLYYGMVISGWIIGNFIYWMPLPELHLLFIFKGVSVFWIPVGYWFCNFVYSFTDKRKDFILYSILGCSLVCVLLSLSTNLVISGVDFFYWGAAIQRGPLYLPIVFFLVFPPIVYGLLLLFFEFRKTSDELRKKQLLFLIIGTGLFMIVSLGSTVIIPVFFQFRKYPPLAASATIIESIFIFIAIVKYKFLTLSVENIAVELFSSVQEGLILVNKDISVRLINEVARKTLGLGSIPLESIRLGEIFPLYSFDAEYKNHEFEINNGVGKKFISLSQSPVNKSGVESGRIVVFRDVTQKKMNEKSIYDSEFKIRKLYSVIMEDLEIARITQKSLISYEFPESEVYRLSSLFEPFEKVGGDIINYRMAEDGHLDIFFADVSGHGVSAAMVASMATIAFNVVSQKNPGPKEGLENIEAMLASNIQQHFISAVYLCFYPETGKILYTYAGHHPMILSRNG